MAAARSSTGAGHVFTDEDLWGSDGVPDADDVRQRRFGDCFLLAAAGGVARQSAQVIQQNIAYDETTGQFSVRLAKDGVWQTLQVNQEELRDNVARKGGSTFENGARGDTGALWPAVYEVGYAKLTKGAWEVGKERLPEGGNPADALHAITGEDPITIRAADVQLMPPADIVRRLNDELADGRRIVMTTAADPGQNTARMTLGERAADLVSTPFRSGVLGDGVVGHHAYMVLGARIDPTSGEALIKVRNTWGHNELKELPPDMRKAAEIEVSVDRLMQRNTESLGKFDIAGLPPQQRGLYEAIRQHVGDHAGQPAVAAAAVQASRDGITTAADVRGATVTDDGKLWVAGATPGYRSMVDPHGPIPPSAESFGALAAEPARLHEALPHPSIDTPGRQLS